MSDLKKIHYFSHDCSARHDPKIIKLRAKFGLEGYGFFFFFLEILSELSENSLKISDLDVVLYQFDGSAKKMKKILDYCIEIELFQVENECLISNSFMRRISKIKHIGETNKENGKKGGRPKKTETETKPKNNRNETETITETKPKQKHRASRESESESENTTTLCVGSERVFHDPSQSQESDFLLWEYFQKQANLLLRDNEKLNEIQAPLKFERYLEYLKNNNYKNPEAAIKKWIHTDIEQIIEVV
jgi:hypothetical protein